MTAAGAPRGIDVNPALSVCDKGARLAATKTGHADNPVPGQAGPAVEADQSDYRRRRLSDPGRCSQGTGRVAGATEGAARDMKIKIRQTGKVMRRRVHSDDVRGAGRHTGVIAVGTCALQWLFPKPGGARAQRLPAPHFLAAAFTCHKRAA